MRESTDILALFESRMREMGLTQTDLSFRAFGKKDNSAIQSLKRGASPAFDRVAAMADALGLEMYLGPPRTPAPVEQIILDSKEYALIPLHTATLSAGSGLANGDNAIIDHLAFRINWLRRLNVAPNHACLARAEGNSMLPTIHPGDMVLIDTARTEPPIYKRRDNDQRRAAIYAFVEGGQARIKRIERPESEVLFLVSDNPNHAPELRTGAQLEQLQMSIIGKVVWWGHTA